MAGATFAQVINSSQSTFTRAPRRCSRAMQLQTCRVAPAAERPLQGSPPSSVVVSFGATVQQGTLAALAAATILIAAPMMAPPESLAATDNAKVGACVLSKCTEQLGRCLGDAKCLENLICIQACTGQEDETGCQIRCGDRYEDSAVDVFNSCAVSDQKCVPQRVDTALFPVPPDCALDRSFDLSAFQGRWYITAGLNPLFDQFPCQEHYFAQPPDGAKDAVYAQINWRIPLSEGDFIPRSTMQRFVQQPDNPAVLLNHGNEYLHYEDDWYILASKPDQYVFVYYRGQNDAWKGYGGATVYTRAASLPEEYVPELRAAAESAGLDWSQFKLTDNSCPAKPPARGPFEELEADLEQAERFASKEVNEIEKTLEPKLESFGRGFTVIAKEVEDVADEVAKGIEQEERLVADAARQEAKAAERLIRRFEMEAKMGLMGKWVQKLPLSVREFIMPMPMR